MKKKTLIQEIDTVLKLACDTSPNGISRIDIRKVLKGKDTDVSYGLIDEITNHLETKEYLHSFKQDVITPSLIKDIQHWTITFNGRLFHLQGGYKGEIKRNTNANRINNLVFVLTAVIAVGTLISGIYYSLEIWRFFHQAPVIK